MVNTKEAELERLKKDYLLMEQRFQDEKKCLSNVIYSLGRVVALHDELLDEFDSLKKLIDPEGELPLVQIEQQVETLKNKIFSQETKQVFDDRNKLEELNDSLLESCRIIKRIVVALVDDFYPTTGELKAKADSIATMPAVYIALASAAQDASCLVAKRAYVRETDWDWDESDNTGVLYVSGATAGGLSLTAISTSGYYSQAVATVVDADTILFNPVPIMAVYA